QIYCDIDNNDVSGSITLEPFSAKVLLACYCNNDGVCNNKENYLTCPNDCDEETTPASSIQFTSPTPSDGSVIDDDFIFVNVSSEDFFNHYSFLNFDNSLLSWLRFENYDSNYVFDESSFNNDAQIFGANIIDNGKFGKAINLNHEDRLFVDEFVLSEQKATVSLWIKPLDLSTNSQRIIRSLGSNTNRYYLMLSPNELRVVRGENSPRTISYTWNYDEWYNIVWQWDSSDSSQKVYINGILEYSGDYSKISNGGDAKLQFGTTSSHEGGYNGYLDEVLVFNRLLSENEVSSLYTSDKHVYSNNFTDLQLNKGHEIKAYSINEQNEKRETETRIINTFTPIKKYYVDNIQGNDNNNGLTPETAWKTLTKVSNTNFNPGDKILLKRGQTFYDETLIVSSSGSTSHPITYGAYGEGEKPIINPSTQISGFELHEGNIYKTNIDVGLNFDYVFVGNERIDIARHPNNNYLFPSQEADNRISLFDHGEFSPEQLIGANIHLRSEPWHLDVRKIVDYDVSSNKISLNSEIHQNSQSNIQPRDGYFLSNKYWMLDQPGEWYYDSETGELYIWSPNSLNPDTLGVRITINNYGMNAHTKENINIKNLTFKKTNKYGLYFYRTQGINIDNILVKESGNDAVFFYSKYSHSDIFSSITNSYFLNSSRDGIRVSNHNNVYLINNTIINSALNSLPVKGYAGLFINSDNVLAENNDILNSNYIGIRYSGNNITLRKNYINNSCMILADCGGIYTSGESTNYVTIENNIIENTLSNFTGTRITSNKGIYLDDKSLNTTIRNNVILNSHRNSIFLHNSRYNTIYNNLAFKSEIPLRYGEGHPMYPEITSGYLNGNNIINNIFISTNPNYETIRQQSYFDLIDFGFQDNNYYYSYPEHRFLNFRENTKNSSLYINRVYTLNEWRNFKNEDHNSVNINDYYDVVPYIVTAYLSDELYANGNFDEGIDGWIQHGGVSLSWEEDCMNNGACLKAIYPLDSSQIRSDFIEIKNNQLYEFNFSIRTTNENQPLVRIRQPTTPWEDVGFNQRIQTNNSWKNFSFLFTGTEDIHNARIYIHTRNTTLFIDDISLRKVEAYYNDVEDDFLLLVNRDRYNEKTFVLDQIYCDIDNNDVSGSITLEPFSAKVLLACYCNNDGVCNNKETYLTCPNDCDEETIFISAT
ncbi:MAG: LamG-like jellyroll fold domain-containing protein, partial [Candidatus Woesearchaeota archaeon]